MADPFVSSETKARLQKRMESLKILEKELQESFVLGSGSGGQKVNKTASCVMLKHLPSGIIVKCQSSRSRDLNRHLARKLLCEKIAERTEGEKSQRQQKAEKIRRQKRRRSRRQKQRMLDDKHHQSNKKNQRKKIDHRLDG